MNNQEISVLMIEDLRVAQVAAYNLFKKLNCKITIVTNASRALELMVVKRFDIIFVDIQLPDIDGYELARTIRNMEGRRVNLPLIAVTANSSYELSGQTQSAGFNDFLIKPLTVESVRNILYKYLSKSGQYSSNQDVA